MAEQKCPKCGGALIRRSVPLAIRVGERTVHDSSAHALACANCDYFDVSQKALQESERRAAIVVLTEADDVSGAVLKFARKSVGLRQVDLGRALDVDAVTVSRWEAAARIDRSVKLAVAQLLTLHETAPERFELLTMRSDGHEPLPCANG